MKNPTKEDDEVVFDIHHGKKGSEARHMVRKNTPHTPLHPTPRCTRNTAEAPEELLQAKILACVYTAKAVAGADHRHLQSLIPLLLQHNGFPAIHVTLLALAPPRHQTQTPQRRTQPGRTHQPKASTTPVQPTTLKPRRTTKPSIALRESPTITRLRQENQSGPVREEVLTGYYFHDGDRFLGSIKGYHEVGYRNFPYPKEKKKPVK
ncbi:hypothetical protein E2C01_048906 [Portunus trituberculatus]|uniref:Uncharacterized protein n=1 Tax=Portunus trituberculatus TaxID=210409 RepID=A0A5B7GC97_PORTR|nr:hypothetical protein [Portunus trituberculatus]